MRIGVNLLYLVPGRVGGTEYYARSLLDALAAQDAANEYLVFVNREAANLPLPTSPNFRRVVCNVAGKSRAARYAWEQFVLPIQMIILRLDLVHSLGYVGPIAARCPHIVTIHDVNYVAQRDTMHWGKRLVLGFFVRLTARRADHVLTVSKFSKAQLITYIPGIDAQRITVTPGAATHAPRAGSEPDVGAEQNGLRCPFVLAFGSLSAHKNIPRLIEAFGRVASSIPHSLVIVGHVADHGELLDAVRRAGVKGRVVFTGYVPDERVQSLLESADLFVFPSLYEGFGLPVLDAQALGVPVACSTAGSLPEVAGEGALYFNPLDVDDIARAISMSITDGALRERLRRCGHENERRFSWESNAEKTLRVYEIVGRSGRDEAAACE